MKPIARAEYEGGVLEATTDALVDNGASLPWHQILRATWSSESAEFHVETVAGARLIWRLTSPGRLPEAARERITATIVAQDWLSLPGVGKVLVIFRHVGEQIETQLLPPIDPTPFALEIARLRAELGIG